MNTTSPQLTIWQRSTSVRFLRWLFRWRTLRAIGFVVFCLVTVVTLAVTEENWRGRRAWEKFRQEGEAKGEGFDWASLTPKPVAPDQNFAMTPFLAPLLDYEFVNGAARWRDSNAVARAQGVSVFLGHNSQREAPPAPSQGNWESGQFCDLTAWQTFYLGNTNYPAPPQPQDPAHDVLFALQKYDAVLSELRAASRRPYAVFPVHYQDGTDALLIHLSVLKNVGQVVQLHALASLEAGRSEDALADVELGVSVANSLRSEPLLISQLVRLAIVQLQIQAIWEGLAKHRWTEAQGQKLQTMLASLDVLDAYGMSLRGERACYDQYVMTLDKQTPKAIRLVGKGWIYQNMLVLDRLYRDAGLPAVDAPRHRVYPEKCDTNAIRSIVGTRTPYNFLAQMLFPSIGRASVRFARSQTAVDLATVACALERCRLAQGQIPETLGALVPRFIDKVPADVFDGQSLRYHPKSDGSFVLYSIGENKVDDGGKLAWTKEKKPKIDYTQGDWVWRCAAQP
jgi:hypothetical protein